MPRDLRVLLASTPLEPADKSANLAGIAQVVSAQGDTQPDLYVFGEANLNGGFWKEGFAPYADLAEEVPDGPSCRAVTELARQYRTTICAGLLERAPAGRCFITHFLCGPDGYIGRQRKMFANNARQQPFADGTEGIGMFCVAGHRCCILACADMLFPEASLLAASLDASLLIAPVDAFDACHQPMLCRVLAARAWDSGAHAVAVFGHDPANQHATLMAAVAASPKGELLACHTRLASASSITQLMLPLTPPDRRWGHPADRLARIAQVSSKT